MAQPGSPLDTRSLLKASMTTLLLRIQRARGCSQGMDCLLRQIRRMLMINTVKHRSHLPLMFVGMEHILLSNYRLADEALDAAYSMCDGDPLLINERAVMAFNHGE